MTNHADASREKQAQFQSQAFALLDNVAHCTKYVPPLNSLVVEDTSSLLGSI
jgi:hypothetical protein